ncbi:MAG: HEAT repeat domain-containing protein [Chloroflexi bacterium]|nr:HEAT repeat domain-containing protein [Chloroflexota bacterium]
METKRQPDSRTQEKIKESAKKLLDLTQQKFGFRLDYSEEALVIADDLITLFFKQHREHFYTAAVFIGCYLGEMIINNLGGKWRYDFSIRKVGKTKVVVNPVHKAKKRLMNGLADSLVFFYRSLKVATTGDTSFAEDKKKINKWKKMLREDGWGGKLLKRVLNGKEPRYVREEAADILGRLGDTTVIPALIKALKSKDSAYYAAIALQGLPEKEAFEPLMKLIKHNRATPVRIQAALALGELKDERALDALVDMLADPDEIINHYASLAIGKIGGEKALNMILDVMGGSRPGNLVYAVSALEGIADKKSVPALIEALFSRNEEVREAAARALQFVPDKRAAQALTFLLKDPNSRIRILAAYALAHIGGDNIQVLLRGLMKDDVYLVRQHAERLLQWLEKGITPAKCV